MSWQAQKLCTDVGDYELVVEKQKRNWECEQTFESWKWSVIYHGTVVSSGSVNDVEEAKIKAQASVPESVEEESENEDNKGSGSSCCD